KLGSAYEPYIFAALNSSKVMVVLGTKPEHFNAVWVKNEWSRYLALIKNGANKMLIPAYRDMDPYDLPEEFSHLQAQDMSKLGFMQDLIHGIKKIASVDEPKQTVVKETAVTGAGASIAPLLERAFMFLEDGDFTSANEYCEKVLDMDPKCARAYLGKLMAELLVRSEDALCNCEEPFDGEDNYKKIMRFADDALKEKLQNDIAHINARKENDRIKSIYARATLKMNTATTQDDYNIAASIFESISAYKDARELREKCLEKAEDARKDAIFDKGVSKMHEGARFGAGDHYQAAISLFQSIPGWKNAEEKIAVCEKHIREIEEMEEAKRLERERRAVIEKAEAEARAKRNKKIAIITTPIVCVVIAFIIVLNAVIIPNIKYNNAIALMEEGNTIEAYEALIALDGYKDSVEKASSIYRKHMVEKIKLAKVGDYVFFGAYEQDNNTENGKEDIEWLVLEVKDGKALVISKYALDCKQYNTDLTGVTWETCTLRKWLNNDFLGAAFSTDEKAIIPTVTVSADKNPKYSTNPGNATQDQVFLLSITEVNKYFSSDSARQCKPTAYAVAKGASVNSDNGNCWWWLRSPGDLQDAAAIVTYGGAVYEYAFYVHAVNSAVRPALWIDLG
ncbi:MAG: TIR domain-containing protein, partial [Clostridia bacterium]|nr:TIR domain-containing protein [Clostridia bacterium]